MPFGLKNAPSMFSRVVVEAFKKNLHKFLEAYFDDWTIFSLLKDHIECLRWMLDNVGGQEVYSFTDGFSGYHQIRIANEDRHKAMFAT